MEESDQTLLTPDVSTEGVPIISPGDEEDPSKRLDFFSLKKSNIPNIKMTRGSKSSTDENPGTKTAGDDTRTKTDLVDDTLGDMLANLIEEIDLYDDQRPHEILQGLSMQGIRTWSSFVRMDEDDIGSMTRPARNKPIPLSNNSIRMITHLKQLIWENIEAQEPNAKDPTHYTKLIFDSYVDQLNIRKRNKVAYSVNSSGLPAFTPTSTKSSGEKKYEAWTRAIGKRTKSSFETLLEDDKYRIWKPVFEAELAHQKMLHAIDPKFDPTSITCSFEKELWKEQQAYLWTILLQVFKNPLGRHSTSSHMHDKHARNAFLEHDQLQEQSPAKAFSTSMYLNKLNNLTIKSHQGGRVDFIATWFEELRQLNELSADSISYDMTKGLLLKALQGDNKLPDVFTELQETGNKIVDIEYLKIALINKAALYDSKDQYLKTEINANYMDTNTDLSFAINRTFRAPNPEARLPDSIFESLAPEDKTAWRRLPESTRVKLARLMQTKQQKGTNDKRSIYWHDSTNESTQDSDLTDDDSAIVQSIRDLVVNATRRKGTNASHTRTPDSSSVDSKRTTPSTRSPSQKAPLLSTLDPAHPSSLLSDKTIDLYDKGGTKHGYINANFHQWYTPQDGPLEKEDTTIKEITYHVSKGEIAKQSTMSLIDRGANGSVAGSDCVWMGNPVSLKSVSITGIDNHQITNIPVGTVGSYSMSNRGPVILIFQEVAYTGRHKTILSSIQLEHYALKVDEKHPRLGGKGTIETPDGYVFPLSFVSGLPYLKMRKYTTEEYFKYPHVFMTSDKDWDPSVYNLNVDPNDPSFRTKYSEQLHMTPHDDYNLEGEYIQNCGDLDRNGHVNFTDWVKTEHNNNNKNNDTIDKEHATCDDNKDDAPFWLNDREYNHHETIARCAKVGMTSRRQHIQVNESKIFNTGLPRIHTPSKRDYHSLKPYFSWLPTNIIEATFKNSTQYGYMPTSPDGNLFKRWKAPNPAMNVFRLHDDLLTDTIYSDTEAIDSNITKAQIFFGRKSHIIHVEPVSTKYTFIKCLQNFVRKWGAPQRLLGDHSITQTSYRVMDYLRMLWIGHWCSEAYYKHQNMFERRYQTFKRIVNRTMDRTNTPPHLWLLCMEYVSYVLNRTSDPSHNHKQPIFLATGQIGDISALLPFRWLEPVYYKAQDSSFPSESPEYFGYWVGISEHVGHAMTFKIWNKTTDKIVERSAVRTALDADTYNLKAQKNTESELYIGIRIAKYFDDILNFGTITEHWIKQKRSLWHVVYDDKDEEDFDRDQLTAAISLYGTHKPTDLKTYTAPRDSPASCTHDYGENTAPSKEFIYSTDKDGLLEPTNNAETAYFNENAHPEDYVVQTSGNTTLNDREYIVLSDEDGNPKLDHKGTPIKIKGIELNDLPGMSFLKKEDDGSTYRVRVLQPLQDQQQQNDNYIKFRIRYDRDQIDDIMTYNDIMNYIYQDRCQDAGYEWKFRTILSHQGPLSRKDPGYKGSKYNVEIEWENGEITFEPFQDIFEDDPLTLAIYAKKNNLLETEGWKQLKRIANREKKLLRTVKQAKLQSFRTAPKYMYGYQVPRTYEEALEIDKCNGNTKWSDATALEMEQLIDYNTFIDKGTFSKANIPKGFQLIKVHLVFAVKHDGRHKSRLVSRGDLTTIPLTSVYAGVVSLRGLRMCIFLAELNGMEAYATDIGNAYLEAVTQEKVCIRAGKEFGKLEGHLLIIYKALYGLRSSGKEFGDLLAACLKELGFVPSMAEAEIFMREKDGLYEYVATYVDDLCLVMKDPIGFLELLKSEPYTFKLKGSGPMSFHLGCGFERDKHGILCMTPKKYIEKMIQTYEQIYGTKPRTKYQSPLLENDHPELDTSEFLDEEGIQQYQSLIGCLQWLITIGRWDIQTAVMTLSSYRAQPRQGHLERIKRIYGYIYRFKHFCLRFRTDEPDMSYLNDKIKFDWTNSVYGDYTEDIPYNAPRPLGKRVTLTHYFDANLMHDVLSGKSVTGCVHLANKTPIMWYSKKQATSETATFGAEFIAGRTCIEQVVDLRNTFRYLGIPINETSYIFGDNETMIQSASFPYARLHKRHNILSYHYVRSMIARGFIALHHLRSENNLSDILTKHWSHNSVYGLLKPVFHHIGNTANLYIDDSPGCLDKYITPSGSNTCLNDTIQQVQ